MEHLNKMVDTDDTKLDNAHMHSSTAFSIF